ncbi:MAG: hypothetical protein AAB426_13100 [Myxococcota bacterium]
MKVTEIFYKCGCTPAEVSLFVPARAPERDVVDWMRFVQNAIGTDHTARSPDCRATVMEYAKIPIEDKLIGGAPREH